MNSFIKALKSMPLGSTDEQHIENAKKALQEYTAHPNIGDKELAWKLGQEINECGNAELFVSAVMQDTSSRMLGKEINTTLIAMSILINTPVAQFKE